MQKILSLFVIFLVLNCTSKAQEKWMKKKGFEVPKKVIIVGYGYPKDTFSVPEGLYHPIFLNYRTYYQHKTWKDKTPNNLQFYLFSEPQINPVMLVKDGVTKWKWEAGINNGIQSEVIFTPKIRFYFYASSGLHFFNTRTKQQVRGFLFADNLGAGFIFKVSENYSLMTMLKIRHMSNADIKQPNHGINTINYLIGWEF